MPEERSGARGIHFCRDCTAYEPCSPALCAGLCLENARLYGDARGMLLISDALKSVVDGFTPACPCSPCWDGGEWRGK